MLADRKSHFFHTVWNKSKNNRSLKNGKNKEYTSPYEMDGRIPWPKAIVYGLQHVLAMFVGNLTPLIVICGACGIGAASDFAEVYVELLQNAMIIAGVVTLVQLLHLSCRWTCSDHYGNEFRFYWCI